MQINISNLSKEYKGGFKALSDVNLEIENGMFGLLGPNGAGKTTLMRILVTLMKPSEGKVSFNGWDLQKNRKEIRSVLGYLPQDFRFFPKLKTWEFLNYSASLTGTKKQKMEMIDEMLDKVGLLDVRERYANKLSGGMKRRLGIAQALIGDPKIIVVDEPTTGLDPEERIRFRNILSELSAKDVIIILSTHIVGDISSTCRNMALLNKGEVVFSGSPEELINMARGSVWRIEALDTELEEIKGKYPVITTIPSAAGWEIEVVAPDASNYNGTQIDPDLEHAYVYFMEYKLQDNRGGII